MHLYKRFKTDALRKSQGHCTTDVFWDVLRVSAWRFSKNCKNVGRLTFKYFTQYIWWVESKIIQQQCFVLSSKLTSIVTRDVTIQASLLDAIRTSLWHLSKIYEKLGKRNCFCYLVVLWNSSLKIL